MPLRELLADRLTAVVLRGRARRWRVLAGVVVLGALGGVLVALLQRPGYESTGQVQMFLRGTPASGQARLRKGGLRNQRELMLGPTFLGEVLDHMAPAARQQLVGVGPILPGKHADSLRAAEASSALAGLKIEPVPGTTLLRVRFRNKDPRLATAVVAATLEAGDELGLRLRTEQTRRVGEAMRERLGAIAAEIAPAEAEQRLRLRRLGLRWSGPGSGGAGTDLLSAPNSALRPAPRPDRPVPSGRRASRRGLPTPTQPDRQAAEATTPGQPGTDPQLADLQEALRSSEVLALVRQSQSRMAQQLSRAGDWEALETLASPADRAELDRARSAEEDVAVRAAGTEALLGGRNPQLLAGEAERDEARAERARIDRRTVEHARGEAELAQRRLVAVQAEYRRRGREVDADLRAEHDEAVRDLDLQVDENLLLGERYALRGAEANSALKASGFYSVDPASVPTHRVLRPFAHDAWLGAVGGLLCGVLVNVLWQLRQGGRWTPDEAEARSGLPVLALVPRQAAPQPGEEAWVDRILEDVATELASALRNGTLGASHMTVALTPLLGARSGLPGSPVWADALAARLAAKLPGELVRSPEQPVSTLVRAPALLGPGQYRLAEADVVLVVVEHGRHTLRQLEAARRALRQLPVRYAGLVVEVTFPLPERS